MNSTIGLPDDHYVRAWMSPPEHQVGIDTKLDEALETMMREEIRHLLVMEQGELVGVVSDRDLRRARAERVADVMSARPITIGPDDTLSYAAEVMVENKVSCLPVLDRGRVRGIVTSNDLLAALVHRESFADEEGDAASGPGADYDLQGAAG
jgi:acetoin utilization protein AcuB